MASLYNWDTYIGQQGTVIFFYESRTNALPFKPMITISRTFLLSFPCLHCRWAIVMEFRAGRGQPRPVPFGLLAGPKSDLWLFHSSLLCSASYQDFYLFQYLWYKIVSQSCHPWIIYFFLRYLGDVFFPSLFSFWTKEMSWKGSSLYFLHSSLHLALLFLFFVF